ncbi:MAG: N-acetyl-gamma-glutamyl-phosphate reductase [Candidatus Omnitrophica bacterium]|nr:N-acetyl-gamma-glutamyl-phosphate reductase [Candidatus Omnitrophota bacterium]
MVHIGIIGALGYTGKEIIHYLTRHRMVKIVRLWDKAVKDSGESLDAIFPEFKNILDIKVEHFHKKDLENIDVVFLSLPHTVSMGIASEISDNVKLIIDLSADYRFKDSNVYEKWYQTAHKDKDNLKKSVYGLPEIARDKIKGSKFIANPGCYPTSMILGLYPLAESGLLKDAQVIVDSKTGSSGAGRKASLGLIFSEINENLKPYKINQHQHMPEVTAFFKEEFKLNFDLSFVPQIIPISRGIISMIYVIFKDKNRKDFRKIYEDCYQKEPFIRLCKKGEVPELKNVANSNFCDLGYLDYVNDNTFLIISAIDNLGKGAASQAVQNMNIALGFDEREALL